MHQHAAPDTAPPLALWSSLPYLADTPVTWHVLGRCQRSHSLAQRTCEMQPNRELPDDVIENCDVIHDDDAIKLPSSIHVSHHPPL